MVSHKKVHAGGYCVLVSRVKKHSRSTQSTSSIFNKSNSITVHADTGWYSFKVAARSVRYNEFAFVMAFLSLLLRRAWESP